MRLRPQFHALSLKKESFERKYRVYQEFGQANIWLWWINFMPQKISSNFKPPLKLLFTLKVVKRGTQKQLAP